MEHMNTADFLDEVRRARAEYDAALAEIPEDQMLEPGVIDEWSVKDVIAHVMWSEREMVGVLKERALIGSELWNLPQDERNALVAEENRLRSLEDVRAEAEMVHVELVPLIQGLTDEEMNDASHFRAMPPDWLPWQVLRGSTYKHYREHAEDLREWWTRRRTQGGSHQDARRRVG